MATWHDELADGGRRSLVVGAPVDADGARWLERLGWRGRGLLVIDRAVAGRSDSVAAAFRRAGLDPVVHVVAGGATIKSWAGILPLYDALIAAEVGRDGWIAAVGGGALSDAVGFVAATYLRGVPWVCIPTTLLAQVDAALGGKTAIDLPQGKNLVGAFHMPDLVWIDPAWLMTLPEREWRSGFGELLKTGLLAGDPLWSRAAEAPPGWDDPEPVMALVEAAARHKLEIVRQDPREQGVRATLNLGHTLGHAVENYAAGDGWSHGEAVGVGLLGALWLSEREEGLSPAVAEAVRRALLRWGMPTRVPPAPASHYWVRIGRDKKRRHDGLRWVLLRAVGEPVVRPVAPARVADMLAALGAEPD